MMEKNWIALQSIPVNGKTVTIDDQSVWASFLEEFRLACRVLAALTAVIEILPQAGGVLFRGRVSGTVCLPCDRCAGEARVELNHAFDSFEPFPADTLHGGPVRPEAEPQEEVDEAVIRNAPQGRGLDINPAALAWQEFSLALPVKPLCGENCKGLCPVCGADRNTENCSCDKERLDPRMAALHGLTLKKK